MDTKVQLNEFESKLIASQNECTYLEAQSEQKSKVAQQDLSTDKLASEGESFDILERIQLMKEMKKLESRITKASLNASPSHTFTSCSDKISLSLFQEYSVSNSHNFIPKLMLSSYTITSDLALNSTQNITTSTVNQLQTEGLKSKDSYGFEKSEVSKMQKQMTLNTIKPKISDCRTVYSETLLDFEIKADSSMDSEYNESKLLSKQSINSVPKLNQDHQASILQINESSLLLDQSIKETRTYSFNKLGSQVDLSQTVGDYYEPIDKSFKSAATFEKKFHETTNDNVQNFENKTFSQGNDCDLATLKCNIGNRNNALKSASGKGCKVILTEDETFIRFNKRGWICALCHNFNFEGRFTIFIIS